MRFNSLYQLLDDLARCPQILELSEQFLGTGDYFNYLFSLSLFLSPSRLLGRYRIMDDSSSEAASSYVLPS
jgi:hypothetical protein